MLDGAHHVASIRYSALHTFEPGEQPVESTPNAPELFRLLVLGPALRPPSLQGGGRVNLQKTDNAPA